MTLIACANPADVPRETLERLQIYARMLVDWQSRINLIGPNTIPDMWQRHFVDSLQLLALAPLGSKWLDIGAGAGFPGLVIAIADRNATVTLVESIAKKCRFLQAVVDRLQISDQVAVENRRVETLGDRNFDIITARALAPLAQIFEWGLPLASPTTCWILPKGARVAAEIEAASHQFKFDYELVESRTDAAGRVVVARHVSRT